MCLTIPLQIKSIKSGVGILSDGRQVSLALISKPKPGDWVLTNADLAVSKVSPEEASEIINYLK